jgi:MoxR-like ATPase
VSVDEVARTGGLLVEAVSRAMIGKRDQIRQVLAVLLAGGHALIEDLPGLGKTLLVRSLAKAAGLGHSRIQFTPDLMPMDITGSTVLDPERRRPEFRPGPIFAHLVLADEVNRAPAKTQAALLEAMQERQVTVDGVTRRLAEPFVVIATENPIEYEGTYPLPEAQLDRFLARLSLGYPSPEDESRVLLERAARGRDEVEVGEVTDREGVLAMQAVVETVHVSGVVARYIVELAAASRSHRRVRVGASPRGALALMRLSRALAALDGRDFVLPDDVQAAAVPTLAHRLVLRPEAWAQGLDERSVIESCLSEVPVPRAVPE